MKFDIECFCDNNYKSLDFSANTYLISNDNECIIIDPANDIKVLKKFIGNKKILGIFLTHGHYDHFAKLKETSDIDKTAKIYMHKLAYKKLGDEISSCARMFNKKILFNVNDLNITFLNENETIKIGTFLVKALYVPGHTNCSLAYLIDDSLFSGDLIFENSIGRTDLPTGNYISISNSLRNILKLSGEIIVYPGHEVSFKLKDVIKSNYYLRKL